MNRLLLITIAALGALFGIVLFWSMGPAAKLTSMVQDSNAEAHAVRPEARFLRLRMTRAGNGDYVITLANTGEGELKVSPIAHVSIRSCFTTNLGTNSRL